MKKLYYILAMTAMLLAGQAKAELTKAGNVITDSISNLSWMELTSTTGISYNQMSLNLLDSNSVFFGYQYANLNQVKTLFQNQGYTGDFNNASTDQQSTDAISAIMTNFGQTGTNCCARGDGMYLNDNGGQVDFLFYVPSMSLARSLNNYFDPNTPEWNGSNGNQLGSWLVMAAVPEPETYAMLLAGLGLIGAASRRRKAAAQATA